MAEKIKQQEEELIEDEIIDAEEIEADEEYSSGDDKPFLEKYGKWIGAGAAIIFLAAIFLIWRGYSRQGDNKIAQKEMIPAEQIYTSVMAGQQPDTLLLTAINGQGPVKGFTSLVSKYGSTDAGNLANYYLGASYLRLGQVDKGIEALEAFKKGNNMTSASAYGALGAAYEDKKKWDEAIENYELAARTPEENSKTSPYFLMAAGRVYESAGKKDNALECYKKIKDRWPLSDEAKMIDKYIGRITLGKSEE